MIAYCRVNLSAKRRKNRLFLVNSNEWPHIYNQNIQSKLTFCGLYSKLEKESNQNHKAVMSDITEITKNTC